MNKDNIAYIYTYNGILFGHKKNEIISLTGTWMDLKNITLHEVKGKYHKYHLHVES